MQRRTEFFYCRKLLVGELVELEYLDRSGGFLAGSISGYCLHVVLEKVESDFYHRGSLGVDVVAYLAIGICPVNIGC